MGHVRLSRASLAIIFFYLFLAAATLGVYLNWGAGWALLAGGSAFAISVLTLHDVDEKKEGER